MTGDAPGPLAFIQPTSGSATLFSLQTVREAA